MASLAIVLAWIAAPSGDEPEISFGGPRIVRLEDGIHSPRIADFDGDGHGDLAVVNNAKARIELLLRRSSAAVAAPASAQEREKNVPADDPIFEKKGVVTEKRVGGFAVGDFDGDGRIDLAWYGTPRALVVAYQGEKGAFDRRREFDVRDGSESPGAMAAGDLDGDGKTDLALLAETDVVVFHQGKQGLGEPKRLPSALKDVPELRIADLDGDGRADLLLLASSDPAALRVRLQLADGTIGPEIAFETPAPLRSIAVAPGEKGNDILAVAQASGTLRRMRLRPEAAPEGGVAFGRPRLFPFGDARASRKRSVAVGDVNGDGRLDVVATDPAAARVLLYLQTPSGELAGPEPYPSYRECTNALVTDLDGDGAREVVVLSGEEKAVGAMAWSEGRLAFPRAIPIDGIPLAMDAADLDGDGAVDLAIASRKDEKAKDASITILYGAKKGAAERVEIALPAASEIGGLAIGDLDRDGRADLLVCMPFDEARVLRGGEGRKLTEIPTDVLTKTVSLRGLTDAACSFGDVDGDGRPELLFASKGYARAVALKPSGEAEILEQANGRPASEIVAAVAVDLDGDKKPEVALLDRAARSILILRRDAHGVFEIERELEVGAFEFAGLLAEDVTGDPRRDLLVVGLEKLGVVPVGRNDLVPAEIDTFESPEREAHLTTITVGDLGGPRGAEVVVLDPGSKRVEILSPQADGWKRLVSWRVYEEKSFERGAGKGEPHAAAIGDVTGDGVSDLVLLAHDRVLVYPRE
ncbi:MAG TPA: VCBS repeat-containing protein [Planctomycetota bacterium]|nr:VCBS repeat-containing protein [Planctomycetota bacterium]